MKYVCNVRLNNVIFSLLRVYKSCLLGAVASMYSACCPISQS